jgi:hypothetical protein
MYASKRTPFDGYARSLAVLCRRRPVDSKAPVSVLVPGTKCSISQF